MTVNKNLHLMLLLANFNQLVCRWSIKGSCQTCLASSVLNCLGKPSTSSWSCGRDKTSQLDQGDLSYCLQSEASKLAAVGAVGKYCVWTEERQTNLNSGFLLSLWWVQSVLCHFFWWSVVPLSCSSTLLLLCLSALYLIYKCLWVEIYPQAMLWLHIMNAFGVL